MGLVVLAFFLLAVFPFAYVRPQRGLLVVAALVPFDGLLPLVPDGLIPAFWKEALLLAVAIAAVVSPNRTPGRSPAMPWLPVLLAFIVFGVVSGVLSHGAAAIYPIKVSFFYAMFIPPIVLFHPFTPRDRDHLVTVMMVVGFITSVYGIVQQVVGGETLASWGYSWNETIRTSGALLRSFSTFALPFPFGLYIMTVLLVGGAVALANPARLRNRLFLMSTPVLLAGMGVSIVRGSYLGFGIGVIFLAIVAYRSLRLWCIGGGVLLAVVLMLVPEKVRRSVFSSSSLDARSSGWSEILSDLSNHPVGMGLGVTGAAADKLAEEAGELRIPYQPDNYYIKLGLELGPVAVVLFCAIMVLSVMAMMKMWQHAELPEDRAFAIGAAAFVIAGAAASVVSTFLEIFPLDAYFWLLISVATMTLRHESPRRMRRPRAVATQKVDNSDIPDAVTARSAGTST